MWVCELVAVCSNTVTNSLYTENITRLLLEFWTLTLVPAQNNNNIKFFQRTITSLPPDYIQLVIYFELYANIF